MEEHFHHHRHLMASIYWQLASRDRTYPTSPFRPTQNGEGQ
jgi:hypothetical protein